MYAVLRHNIDRRPNGRRGSSIVWFGIPEDRYNYAQEIYTTHDGYLEDEAGRSCGLWICEYETLLDLIRQANDYTQVGLAEATGIPLRTIQEYCQGRKKLLNASIERVWKLAKALCCKMEDLIDQELVDQDLIDQEVGI